MYVAGLFLFLLLLPSSTFASQLQNIQDAFGATDINIPHLIFPDDSLEVFGSFDALTFPEYRGQENFTKNISSVSDSRGVIYYSNDTFIKLIDGSNDTDIKKIIPFGSDSFILSGSGSLLNSQLEKQLFYNLSDLSIKPIFEQQLDTIESILVDYPLVYFGGNFSYDNGSSVGHSVAVWNYTSNKTGLLPFVGFGENSMVNSIVKLNLDNILFTGSFSTLDDPSLLKERSNGQNESQINNGTDIEGGEVIPLQLATWNTDESASFDPSAFTCTDPDRESWSLSLTQGTLECILPYEISPKKIRIYNSPYESNEISLFRIITRPSNSFMNLTYVDPMTGELRYCDAFCPLTRREHLKNLTMNSSSTQLIRIDNNLTNVQWSDSYQDFAFVNELAVSDLQFLALSSYGESVGLSSFELYQETLVTYANNSLNELGCTSGTNRSFSSLSGSHWQQKLVGKSYLATDYETDQSIIPEVVFYPQVKYPGYYTINMYTPGCQADNTCSTRSVVNVTVWSKDDDSILSTALLYQNNEEMKYDQLYSGHLKSAPMITLKYHSSVFPNNPSNNVVADRIEVLIHSIDKLTNDSWPNITLNGMFQYQLSNFTNAGNDNSIGNTTLNTYAVDNLPANSSLYSCVFDDTLWLGGSVSGLARIVLNDDLTVTSDNRIATGGSVEKIFLYSGGILMFGAFNISSQFVTTLTYNGTFNSFGNLGSGFKSFANISFEDAELLVFNNEFMFNLSSNTFSSNTSNFGLSLWSAGQNSEGDLLFSGAVSKNQFANLGGSATIFSNTSISRTTSKDGVQPYLGFRLNDTMKVYACHVGSQSLLIFDDKQTGPWAWSGVINSMRYSNNSKILAVGSTYLENSSQLTLLNLTSFETLANITFQDNSTVTSMVFYDKNSTLIVGGNYSAPDANCTDLCLYDYRLKRWSKVANGSVTGDITEMQISETYDLLISGSFGTDNLTSINLASLNMSTYELTPLLWSSGETLNSFVLIERTIIAWNDTSILYYDDERWENLKLNSNQTSLISSLIGVDTETRLRNRDESNSKVNAILIAGQFHGPPFDGPTLSMLYDFNDWSPYFIANTLDGGESPHMTFITNNDLSSIYDSQSFLPNHEHNVTATISSSTTSSSPTAAIHSAPQKSGKIDRGFIVLIGLALALGTVAVIGVTGVLLAYVFKDGNGYDQIDPRIDECEMIDTVPPEKLLKFL